MRFPNFTSANFATLSHANSWSISTGAMANLRKQEIAAAHKKTPAQVVLRWHLQQPGVVAIPKSATPARIRENFNIFDFTLSAAEMTRLSALARSNGRIVQPGVAPKWD